MISPNDLNRSNSTPLEVQFFYGGMPCKGESNRALIAELKSITLALTMGLPLPPKKDSPNDINP